MDSRDKETHQSQRCPRLASMSLLPSRKVAGATLLQCFQFCFCGLSPARPWLQCTAGEPAPFTTRKLAPAKILGPVLLSQAVLKKVRWDGLEALAKPSRRLSCIWSRGQPCQLCRRVGLGNAKSATFQPLPCKAINKQPHWAGRKKPQ